MERIFDQLREEDVLGSRKDIRKINLVWEVVNEDISFIRVKIVKNIVRDKVCFKGRGRS